ncbi:MAG: hypothetical protein ABUK01_16845, partial [Leptospirales bacterium]
MTIQEIESINKASSPDPEEELYHFLFDLALQSGLVSLDGKSTAIDLSDPRLQDQIQRLAELTGV